jgi:hypothetical protein
VNVRSVRETLTKDSGLGGLAATFVERSGWIACRRSGIPGPATLSETRRTHARPARHRRPGRRGLKAASGNVTRHNATLRPFLASVLARRAGIVGADFVELATPEHSRGPQLTVDVDVAAQKAWCLPRLTCCHGHAHHPVGGDPTPDPVRTGALNAQNLMRGQRFARVRDVGTIDHAGETRSRRGHLQGMVRALTVVPLNPLFERLLGGP